MAVEPGLSVEVEMKTEELIVHLIKMMPTAKTNEGSAMFVELLEQIVSDMSGGATVRSVAGFCCNSPTKLWMKTFFLIFFIASRAHQRTIQYPRV